MSKLQVWEVKSIFPPHKVVGTVLARDEDSALLVAREYVDYNCTVDNQTWSQRPKDGF